MAEAPSKKLFTLVQRELQEYKNSLCWTPVVIACLLTLVMLGSVLLANRISVMGDAVLQVILQEQSASGMNITIHIDSDDDTGDTLEYTVEEEMGDTDDWDFDREWTFSPRGSPDLADELDEKLESLNPLLNVVHILLLLVLIFVTANYLLGALYTDRKDRSILFWRSMPVSEWEEVLSKFAVALLVAPTIYIAVSVLTQFVVVLLSMLLVWRMDMDPYQLVLGNIDFGRLLFDQVGGWILTALLIAPACAWLLLASAAARRSPFMLAVGPVIGLVVVEKIFLGSGYIAGAVSRHIPGVVENAAVGFYVNGPDWSAVSGISIVSGLIFCAALLWFTVLLRKYRWEI
jgi:ABC-2 type transport system permease protein